MSKSTKPATTAKPAPAPAPAFDPSKARALAHTALFAHAGTGRTVGYVQPADKDQAHLFGVNRRYIATVPTSELPDVIPTEAPPATPAAAE